MPYHDYIYRNGYIVNINMNRDNDNINAGRDSYIIYEYIDTDNILKTRYYVNIDERYNHIIYKRKDMDYIYIRRWYQRERRYQCVVGHISFILL